MSEHYDPRVDRHIYLPDPTTGCQCLNDWINLAMAALDQADFSAEACKRIEQTILRPENLPVPRYRR